MDCMGAGMLPAGAPTCFVLSSASLAIQQTAMHQAPYTLPLPLQEGPAAGSGEGGQTEECTATPSGTEVPNLAAVAVFWDPYTVPDNPIFHSTAVCGVALSTDAARLASGGNDMQVSWSRGPAEECMFVVALPHSWLAVAAACSRVALCAWQARAPIPPDSLQDA